MLGPLADATYERGFVRLQPGDLLVLYTDGMIEASAGPRLDRGRRHRLRHRPPRRPRPDPRRPPGARDRRRRSTPTSRPSARDAPPAGRPHGGRRVLPAVAAAAWRAAGRRARYDLDHESPRWNALVVRADLGLWRRLVEQRVAGARRPALRFGEQLASAQHRIPADAGDGGEGGGGDAAARGGEGDRAEDPAEAFEQFERDRAEVNRMAEGQPAVVDEPPPPPE